jgi:hypothetical protein
VEKVWNISWWTITSPLLGIVIVMCILSIPFIVETVPKLLRGKRYSDYWIDFHAVFATVSKYLPSIQL